MWTIPATLPVIHEALYEQATAPANTHWWIKTVEPETAKPTRVHVMRGTFPDAWLTYECAASWYRTDEDELAEGIRQATTIARALAQQVPTLIQVGKDTHEELKYGRDANTNITTGEIDPDYTRAEQIRMKAAEETWKRMAPTLETSRTFLEKNDIIQWACETMNGDLSGVNALA